ncbi:hypothetical protein ACQUZF_10180, partial [Streptococcus pyogenes]
MESHVALYYLNTQVFGMEQNQDLSVSGPVALQQGGGGKKERKTTEMGETVKPSCLPSEVKHPFHSDKNDCTQSLT